MFSKIRNTRYMQYVSVLTATFAITSGGTYVTWPSPTIPILASENTPLNKPITANEASWIIISLLMVPLPFIFIGGWLLDRYGRKICLLLTGILIALPWIAIIFAKTVVEICIARSIAGVGFATVLIGCSMYIAEISDKDIRGKLGTALITMKLAGSIIVFSIGPFVSYTALAGICFIFPIVFLALFCFMPESPYYLVKIGEHDRARDTIRRISPENEDKAAIEGKLEAIQSLVEKDMMNKSSMKELITNRDNRKALLIVFGLKTLQQLSGHGALEPYLQSILQRIETSITPEVSSIIFGIVPLPASLLCGALVDKMGRKPLLIMSAMGCAVALVAEGVYFYLHEVVQADVSAISWLPTAGFVLLQFTYSLGVSSVPLVIMSELFATNIKGQAIAVAYFYAGVLGLLLATFLQPIAGAIGIYTTFWIFALVCVTGAIFVHFAVPETKGKSFADIQKQLKGHLDGGDQRRKDKV